jgi:hypothetical protein
MCERNGKFLMLNLVLNIVTTELQMVNTTCKIFNICCGHIMSYFPVLCYSISDIFLHLSSLLHFDKSSVLLEVFGKM